MKCELCGGATIERACKIVCLNCGYQRDCSDPIRPYPGGEAEWRLVRLAR